MTTKGEMTMNQDKSAIAQLAQSDRVPEGGVGCMFEADAAAPAPAVGDSLTRLAGLASALLEEQWRAAGLDEQLIASEARIRQLAEVDIPELLKECGLSEVKLADGTKVTVAPDLECAITEERKASALQWLRDHDLGGIIKTEVALAFGRGEELQARALQQALSIGIPDGARIAILDHAMSCGVPQDMLAALDAVLTEPPAPTVDESVHWQTLKATLKAERAAGRDVPAETFALRPFERAKLTLPDGVAKPPAIRKRK